MKTILLFSSIFFIVVAYSKSQLNNNSESIIGVKIYEYKGDIIKLFEKWKRIKINTVFASPKLLSNNEFKKYAKQYNVETFVILPIFFDPEKLENDSSLFAITQYGKKAKKEWVKFVCPSQKDFIENKIRFIIDFVKEHQPTGISLDFIRYFTFWEKVYPYTDIDILPNTCFDEKCLAGFSESNKIGFPSRYKTENEKYDWIRENHFDEWVNWKSNLITKTVKSIVERVKKINPKIKVNLHAVPWRQNDFNGAIKSVIGQDFKALAKYVDFISPMTYSHMVKQKPEWIHSVVEDIHNISKTKILPSIQVGIAYLDNKLTVNEFEQYIDEALKPPSSGVIFWNWSALDKEKEKYNLVKKKLH
jgi:hypothetical protein